MKQKNTNDFIFDENMAHQLGLGIFRYQLRPKEKFLYANAACREIIGFLKNRDLAQADFHCIFNKKEYTAWMKLLRERKQVRQYLMRINTQKNKARWISVSACISGGPRRPSIQGILQDVSDFQKEREKNFQEIDLLQSFLDQMPDAIYFKDRKSRITRVNQFYAQGFKLPKEKITGKTDFDFFPKNQARKMFEDDQKVIKTGIPIVGKIERTLLPNGTWNQVITTKIPIFGLQGEINGLMGITRDMTEHAILEKERFTMLMNALTVLNKALELRDPYTFSHARNVGRIAEIIGQQMGFDEERLIRIKLAADLHDLGKIGVPLDILTKPGNLSDLEYRLIKQHVQCCHDLIKEINFPFALSEIIYQHHERLDGSGYPNRLRGKKIMLEAKILAVSDVLESMTSHRPYRAALGIRKAIQELKSGSGKKYDEEIVKIVMRLIRKNKGNPFWRED